MNRFHTAVALLTLSACGFAAHHHHVRHHRHAHRRTHHRHAAAPYKPHHFDDAGHPIRYSEFKLGHARYHVVIANVADPAVEASTVLYRGLSTVWNLVRTPHACAAVTGTFFAPRSGYPVGDVVVDGTLKVFGRRGSAMAIDYYGQPHVFDTEFGKSVDWSPYRWALRGTVRLVRDGRPSPNPKAQKFHDRRIWSRVARTGAGVTQSGKLVLIATTSPVTLTEFARAMIKLGVRDAVNLDGGSSTCLFYRGIVVIRPGRRLSNMLVLTEIESAKGSARVRASATSIYLNQ